MTRVLVVNSGSATIKHQLLEMPEAVVIASGLVEGIGRPRSVITHRARDPEGRLRETRTEESIPDHRRGLEQVLTRLDVGRELAGIGHRVVHGGERFREPVLVDAAVLEAIRALEGLAPLHNPASVLGIQATQAMFRSVPQVAVFDTAFHHTLPPQAYRYAIPEDLYRTHHVRRYGFHGISHQYVARRAAAILAQPPGKLNLITLHLGNGASAAAIRAGISVDTSMGMTPLEGLVMGTRCGDLDPAVPAYLARVSGKRLDEVEHLLYAESGLQGLAGVRDMREIERRALQGDGAAVLALEVFSYRVKKYVGAYAAALGRVDALVFTGGIGENSPGVRSRCLENLAILGVELEESRNRAASNAEREIQRVGAAVRVLVIPTDEEREIADQTLRCIQAARIG